MAVTLSGDLLARYPRFSLYNSPYPAHDEGRAVDLYPDDGAPSPVAGEVVETHTVRAPPKPYAPEHDHLVVVRVDQAATPGLASTRDDLLARIMHVDPGVEAGDRVAVGDPLGSMVRAGFFAPWVGNHLHVGFRTPDQNLLRASGSLPLAVDVPVEPLDWDGTGTVVETGETYALLDSPAHPHPGDGFAGIAADSGGVLDGGLRHYDGGGLLGGSGGEHEVSLLGTPVGEATGRTVDWHDVEILANDEQVTGLSLFLAQDDGFGAKVICPGHSFAVGESISVAIGRTDEPVILG
ncbi:hypothetical protein [Haloarchaeobius amylolyticus]|uniref:hypothetical protein n=1 Tax=Haloarchaeobius amylolyticus TaxID=1198296 RepID=UPI00226D4B37|nr:hypothetical protein [Haloarchaeobius amylolyticus]